MAAISALMTRDEVHQLVRRKNWAAKNVGPMVVFCIVGVVGLFLIGLWVRSFLKKRSNNKSQI